MFECHFCEALNVCFIYSSSNSGIRVHNPCEPPPPDSWLINLTCDSLFIVYSLSENFGLPISTDEVCLKW